MSDRKNKYNRHFVMGGNLTLPMSLDDRSAFKVSDLVGREFPFPPDKHGVRHHPSFQGADQKKAVLRVIFSTKLDVSVSEMLTKLENLGHRPATLPEVIGLRTIGHDPDLDEIFRLASYNWQRNGGHEGELDQLSFLVLGTEIFHTEEECQPVMLSLTKTRGFNGLIVDYNKKADQLSTGMRFGQAIPIVSMT